MSRPSLTDQQTTQALQAYITAREQAVRYVLSALDATAVDATSRPYQAVLARVQELIATEIARYTEETEPIPEADPSLTPAEEPAHDGAEH